MPQLVRSPLETISHGLCPACLAFYYSGPTFLDAFPKTISTVDRDAPIAPGERGAAEETRDGE